MQSVIKIIVIIIFLGGILLIALYGVAMLGFTGFFDKKYTREDLEQYFIQHEAEFEDLVNYFDLITSKNPNKEIDFYIKKTNQIGLLIKGNIYPQQFISIEGDITAKNLRFDSVLNALDWKKEILVNLKNKLAKTNCTTIRKKFNGKIFAQPYQYGWGSFHYLFHPESITDSLSNIYGRSLSKSKFGKRVTLQYSSTL